MTGQPETVAEIFLREATAAQSVALASIERNGYVFDKWPPEVIPAERWNARTLAALDPEVRWQGLAFSLYTVICQISSHAERTAEDLRESAAAARAEAFAEIRRGVEKVPVLMREMFGSGDDRTVTDLIDRAAVLALLPPVPPDDHLRGDHELWPGEGD